MENYEKELIGLIKITDKNLGYRPQTPSEFNQLIVAIKKKVGHSISLSSAKRLWGYVNYSNVPPSISSTYCRALMISMIGRISCVGMARWGLMRIPISLMIT